MEVKGVNARLIDVTMADGTKITESGQTSYGPLAWGNCCQVGYDAAYSVTAPYFAASYENDVLTADVSFRYEMGKVSGNGSGTSISTIDMNNDGTIEPIEENVASIDNATKHPVNYDYNYLSYSLGASYKMNENNAVFGRISRGGSAKADRIIWPGANHLSVGNPKDMINQGELGWKSKFGFGGLYVTAFYAKTTEEGGFEATTQKVIKNNYLATGLELETALKFGDFSLRGGATYTHARISDGDNKGNVPRRQAAFMYNFLPAYSFGKHSVGFSFIGQTKAYTQDVNQLVIPGYIVTNFFVNFAVTKDFYLTFNGNNLFNVIGITEAEEGAINESAAVNYIRGRSILGRSISATLRYNF
jgi:outer membrane receptor protein involved in Fe transport